MGGIVWCLKNCLIDMEILSMKNFELYEPVDNILTQEVKSNELKKIFSKQRYMVANCFNFLFWLSFDKKKKVLLLKTFFLRS
jgi:hypothetical protein